MGQANAVGPTSIEGSFVTDVQRGLSVCVSLSVARSRPVSPVKTAEPIGVPFRVGSLEGPWEPLY